MTEERAKFLKRIEAKEPLSEEERIALGLDGKKIAELDDRSNVVFNAMYQSTKLKGEGR